MGRTHFNALSKPQLSSVFQALRSALAKRGCNLLEVHVVGGYGRVLHEGLKAASAADHQNLLDGSPKRAGDLDLLVRYRRSPTAATIDARELEGELNADVDPSCPPSKDYRLDLSLTEDVIVSRSTSTIRVFP
jgi:hypothetical protein